MDKISNKAKQKLMGLVEIIIGIIFYYALPDECGVGVLLIIMGIFFVFAKKQYMDFD